MSMREIPARMIGGNIDSKAIFEASRAIQVNGGMNYEGLTKSKKELKVIGIDIDKEGKLDKFINIGEQQIMPFHSVLGTSGISLSAPQDSFIGTDTFEISNQLIQDASPENAIEDSPLNTMMPFRTFDAITAQQDIMSSFWGWADGDNGTFGAINVVPLLETISNQYKGYETSEISFLEGNDLIKLREVGASDTEKRGAVQKLNMGQLNLLRRAGTGLELNRIEALVKGIWTYRSSLTPTDPLKISQQIPAGNVTTLTQSLGSYVTSTNVFTPNSGLTVNPLVQLGQMITTIKNAGWDIEKIVMDNIVYGAIFNCSAVSSQTQYVTMNSDNDVMGVRRNLFRITTIPALQGIDIEVDNRAVKINSNTTTRLNTRPLWWGKTVETASFRALIVVRPRELTRIGDFGFFPNIYARTTQISGGTRSMGGYGGGIVMVNQDLAVQNILNQKIQILAASNSSPMTYLPNGVFTFDFNVTVS
mgnify:CR=1 FL=1